MLVQILEEIIIGLTSINRTVSVKIYGTHPIKPRERKEQEQENK